MKILIALACCAIIACAVVFLGSKYNSGPTAQQQTIDQMERASKGLDKAYGQ